MKFLKIFATVSIDFVALLSSIVTSTGLLVNASVVLIQHWQKQYINMCYAFFNNRRQLESGRMGTCF
jgi:hypothetical protein